MKSHYTSEMIDALEAGAELRVLAALGMGWHWVVDEGNCEGGFWIGADGILASMCSDWWPDSAWRDAGRLLDEAKRWRVSKSDDDTPAWKHMAVIDFSEAHDECPKLAITRAFCRARLGVINKALEEGE